MNDETQVIETAPEQADQDYNEPTETVESGEEQPEEQVEAKTKEPWYQRRINELTKEKHDARRQAETLERVLRQQEQLLNQFNPQQKAPEPAGPVPPDPNAYAGGQYDPRYMSDMLDYTRQSAVLEAKQAIAQEYEQRSQQQQIAAAQQRLESAEATARSKYSDYDAVIEQITSDPRLAQNATIRQALLGLDNGPDIAYQLGRNLDVAYEIANMNPIQAGMRLAEIIGTTSAARKSNAPTPIKPINGTGATAGKKVLGDMSTAEYIATRNAEERAARLERQRR